MTINELTVRFEEPGCPVPRTAADRRAFALALRQRPGVWALLGWHATAGTAGQDAYEIRRALRSPNAAFTPGEYEAFSRDVFGEHRVYVRYVGAGGEGRG